MKKKYAKHIQLLKKIQILLIFACLIALVVYLYVVFRPKIKVYEYKDECGPMPGGGGISHSVNDAGSCNNACYSLCVSKKMKFKKAEFELLDPSCNKCTCKCSSW